MIGVFYGSRGPDAMIKPAESPALGFEIMDKPALIGENEGSVSF
jgi:hypothetical protein